MRWVAKCGKVGYTAFEGSLAAQTDFAEYCGEVCKSGEPGCWKPADPPKDPHYTVPEGVIKSRIEGRWYRVAAPVEMSAKRTTIRKRVPTQTSSSTVPTVVREGAAAGCL